MCVQVVLCAHVQDEHLRVEQRRGLGALARSRLGRGKRVVREEKLVPLVRLRGVRVDVRRDFLLRYVEDLRPQGPSFVGQM